MDINTFTERSIGDRDKPFVLCKGSLFDLNFDEYFVIVHTRALKCDSLLAAIDLAYKCYYVFKQDFPAECAGAWQFIDNVIFKMRQTCAISSTVKEISAFVLNES